MIQFSEVYGPEPKSEDYHHLKGDPYRMQFRGARDLYTRLRHGFVGVKAVINEKGEIEAPEVVTAQQRAELAPAIRIATKLPSRVYVCLWNQGEDQDAGPDLYAVTADMQVPGGSDATSLMLEKRPFTLRIDPFIEIGRNDPDSVAEAVDKMLADELGELIQKGIPVYLKDASLLPPALQKKNAENIAAAAANAPAEETGDTDGDGTALDDLPNL